MKWLLYLLLAGVVLIIGIFAFLGFMIWNHERGYPRTILTEEAKGKCFVTKKPFVLVRNELGDPRTRVLQLLPVPDQTKHIYTDYELGVFLTVDGEEMRDVSEAIDVPVGARFILKEGYQDRTLNKTRYAYWLEPLDIALDSLYVFYASALSGTPEEMTRFPGNDLFAGA